MSSMRCLISGLLAISPSCRYWAAIWRKIFANSHRPSPRPLSAPLCVSPARAALVAHLIDSPSLTPPRLASRHPWRLASGDPPGRSLRIVVARREPGCPAGGQFLLGHDAIATGQQRLQQSRGALLTELFIEGRSVLERASGLQAQLGE